MELAFDGRMSASSNWELEWRWEREYCWLDWNGVLARFGNNKFVAREVVRGAKVRLVKKGVVEWEVVAALRNTLHWIIEETEEECD